MFGNLDGLRRAKYSINTQDDKHAGQCKLERRENSSTPFCQSNGFRILPWASFWQAIKDPLLLQDE